MVIDPAHAGEHIAASVGASTPAGTAWPSIEGKMNRTARKRRPARVSRRGPKNALKVETLRLHLDWPLGARLELKPVKHYLGFRHNYRFGHPAVETDAHGDQAQEQDHIRMERSEDRKEENRFCDEVGKQKPVDLMKLRNAEMVILINLIVPKRNN